MTYKNHVLLTREEWARHVAGEPVGKPAEPQATRKLRRGDPNVALIPEDERGTAVVQARAADGSPDRNSTSRKGKKNLTVEEKRHIALIDASLADVATLTGFNRSTISAWRTAYRSVDDGQ